ncbi:hypothetical protein LCGC14_1215830 [marine sediment metagenome]|uniref:Uncharacterized protein n=1 Tax=marine sediment metagenome TaxID=412755 RepID=A0A0F9PHB2_9ZZZZ
MTEPKSNPLSAEGLRLLGAFREATGDPIGADQLARGIKVAHKIGGQGCRYCGDEKAETRFGMCFKCAMKDEPKPGKGDK